MTQNIDLKHIGKNVSALSHLTHERAVSVWNGFDFPYSSPCGAVLCICILWLR